LSGSGVLAYGIGYAYAGWAISAAAGVGYAASLVLRGRRAAARVPEGKRRWSDPS
jgi:hypothetical protein